MKLRTNEIMNKDMNLMNNINALVRELIQINAFDLFSDADPELKLKLSIPLRTEKSVYFQTEYMSEPTTDIESIKGSKKAFEGLCRRKGFEACSIEINKEKNTFELELR